MERTFTYTIQSNPTDKTEITQRTDLYGNSSNFVFKVFVFYIYLFWVSFDLDQERTFLI